MDSRLPSEWIAELIKRTDIVAVIGARVPLKMKGDNAFACCPFHDEKTPSFSVNKKGQFFHCFGCNASGNVITFLMRFENRGFLEVVGDLAQITGMQMPGIKSTTPPLSGVLEQACEYYRKQLAQSSKAQQYLEQRGLSAALIERYWIGWAPKGWDHLSTKAKIKSQALLIKSGLCSQSERGGVVDRFRERIMFPIRDASGKLTGFGGRSITDQQPKYLNSPKTPVFHKNTQLYGIYEARSFLKKDTPLLVVEGYMDVLALANCNFNAAVATLGTAVTRQQCTQLLNHAQNIIFCFDGDEAGFKASERALDESLALIKPGQEIRFIDLEEGLDPDSLVKQKGAAVMQTLIDNAMSLEDVLFRGLGKAKDESLSRRAAKIQALSERIEKTNPALRGLLRQRLEISTGVQLQDTAIQGARGPLKKRSVRPMSTVSKVIQAILLNPSLAIDYPILDEIDPGAGRGPLLIQELVQVIRRADILPTTGELLQHFSETSEEGPLKKLLSRTHNQSHRDGFSELIAYIVRKQLEEELDLLIHSDITPDSEEAKRIGMITKRLKELSPSSSYKS